MSLVDILFPKRCLGCSKSGTYLCENCIASSRFARQICAECGRPSIDGITHSKCKRALSLDGVVSVWVYEGAIRKSIISLKYKFASEIAKELALHIARFLRETFNALPTEAVLTPIPLHRLRKNWRGFNQSEEIAKYTSLLMDWDYQDGVLVRQKSTRAQIELGGKERRENVFGAFCFDSRFKRLVEDRRSFILFDDVITTGATLKEAGKVLKRNGAKTVWGLTIAR